MYYGVCQLVANLFKENKTAMQSHKMIFEESWWRLSFDAFKNDCFNGNETSQLKNVFPMFKTAGSNACVHFQFYFRPVIGLVP